MGLRQDVTSSARLAVSEELWLFVEMGIAVLAYAVWVGLTGAALSFGVDAAEVSLSPTPWTGTKTAIVVLAAVAWLVVPAILATRLLVDRLTNESGNLSQHYRFRHPIALLVPPIALFVVVAVTVVALDPAPWPLLVVLVAASTVVLIRTVAYGYRVFALSVPRALQVIVFLAALAIAAALLTGGALLAGRGSSLVAIVSGFGDAAGAAGLGFLVGGRVDAAGVELPTVVAGAVAGSVGLSVLYVLAQAVAAGVARVREPDVPRAQLRTGQRHPEFARPTTNAGQSIPSSTTATADALDGGNAATQGGDDSAGIDAATSGYDAPDSPTDATDPSSTVSATADDHSTGGENDEEELIDDVSHTRVYTPPDGSDAGDDGGDSDDSDAKGTDGPSGVGGSAGPDQDAPTEIVTDACSACGEPLDPDADYGFCPTCGERL